MLSLRHQTTDMLPDEAGEDTPLDWGKHEDEIVDLFVSKKRKWKEVMEHMSAKHNFNARYAHHEASSTALDITSG